MAARRLIRVSFVDAATGRCFSWTEMPAEQLPTSFEARTILNMEGQDWEVVAAEPMTRAQGNRIKNKALFAFSFRSA